MRITKKSETQERSVKEEINGREHLKRISINFWRVNETRKVRERKNQRIKYWRRRGRRKKGKILQKWVTHEHESENHTVVAC